MVAVGAMKKILRLVLLVVLICIGLVKESYAVDYRGSQCANFVRGQFEFGEAGEGCDVNAYTSLSKVLFTYQDFVYDRQNSSREIREEYVSHIVGLIADLSRFYIKQRKPSASQKEQDAWVRAILAKGNQETYLSHYRVDKDSRVKLTTGDRLYSYGIMQIHRRWHKIQDTEIGVDIVENILYALDHYYSFWEASKKKSCVRGHEKKDDYYKRVARSSYAAYNGGPGSYCRWTNSGSRWAQNDRGYRQKWDSQLWLEYSKEHQDKLKSPVDITCLMAGEGLCQHQGKADAYAADGIVYMKDGKTCRPNGEGELACFSDSRTLNCLNPDEAKLLDNLKGYIKTSELEELKLSVYENRDELCQKNYTDLLPLFSFVKPKKAINVRATPGGRKLTGVSPKKVYQILDYDLKPDGSGGRFYKVYANGHFGYIYSGDTESKDDWVVAVEDEPADTIIPMGGQVIEVTKKEGIKLLESPEDSSSEDFLGLVEKGEEVTVEGLRVIGEERQIFIQVMHNGQLGWIYSGRIHPTVTIKNWIKVK